jgi:hypothetical protein
MNSRDEKLRPLARRRLIANGDLCPHCDAGWHQIAGNSHGGYRCKDCDTQWDRVDGDEQHAEPIIVEDDR